MKLKQFLLPILIALFSAPTIFGQDARKLSPDDFEKKIGQETSYQLLDVRTKKEYDEGHLRNSKNVDYNALNFDEEIAALDKTKPVYVYCLYGGRSADASKELLAKGFKEVYDLEGGIRKWKQSGKTLEESKESNTKGEVTKKDLNDALSNNKYVLVDFGAKWCGPCKKMEPSIEKLSNDKNMNLKVLKVDVDESEALSIDLKIEVLPTLHLYKDKKLVWQGEGYMTEDQLRKTIATYTK
jgi:thioredoxin 1